MVDGGVYVLEEEEGTVSVLFSFGGLLRAIPWPFTYYPVGLLPNEFSRY